MHFIIKKYFVLFLLIVLQASGLTQNDIRELYKQSAAGFKTGRYDEALIANIKALKIAEQKADCPQIAYAFLQVGKMQYYNKDNRQALNYFLKGLKIIDSCGIDSLKHVAYHNIGSMYTELNITDSALLFLERSKQILEGSKNYSSLSKVNAVMAELYLLGIKDFSKAEKHIVNAEKFAKLSNEKKWIAFALMKRGMLYKLQKNYVKALAAFKGALNIYNEMNAAEGKLYAMKNILDVLSLTGDPETNVYLFKYINLKDSVFKEEGAAKIAEYKTIYETEKKETENKLLQQQNKLDQSEIESKNKAIIGLMVGVLLIFIILFWRLSVLNLKKKERELRSTIAMQKERERISRDLHDNVGGQLSYVLYSIDGIKEQDEEKRLMIANNINDSVRNVIRSLRETIWAINDDSISVNDFSDKLKVYIRTMFKNTEVKISFNEHIDQNIQLNSLVGLNLYRVCQEIVNNAFKHSKATALNITISSKENLSITISDNGVGFDVEKINDAGYGLSNIKSRTDEIGVGMTLQTGSGIGTTYTFVV